MINISIYLNTTLWQFLKKQAENPIDLMGHTSKTHQKPAQKNKKYIHRMLLKYKTLL
jgi:hypothetical protein